MIRLYKQADSTVGTAVQEALENLVISHVVVPVEGPTVRIAGKEYDLPAIDQSGTIVRGADAVEQYIDELTDEVTADRQVSGDACYLDPDDPTRCIEPTVRPMTVNY